MFQGFSSAFWFGHGLIYQEMGILRQSAFDHACLRRICLDRQGCEKQTRSGSIFSETTEMALERARGYRICTGKQHLFTKLPSGYWRLGICSHRFPLVILHEGHPCPKLQNPLFQKAKENLLPGEKVPVRADEGWGKVLYPGPHPPPATVPPLPEGGGYSLDDGFCDSALRLRAEWRHCRRYPGFIKEWRKYSVLYLWSSFYSPDFNCLWGTRWQGWEVCYRIIPIILCRTPCRLQKSSAGGSGYQETSASWKFISSKTQDEGIGMQSINVFKGQNLLCFGIRAHVIWGSSQHQESNPD